MTFETTPWRRFGVGRGSNDVGVCTCTKLYIFTQLAQLVYYRGQFLVCEACNFQTFLSPVSFATLCCILQIALVSMSNPHIKSHLITYSGHFSCRRSLRTRFGYCFNITLHIIYESLSHSCLALAIVSPHNCLSCSPPIIISVSSHPSLWVMRGSTGVKPRKASRGDMHDLSTQGL